MSIFCCSDTAPRAFSFQAGFFASLKVFTALGHVLCGCVIPPLLRCLASSLRLQPDQTAMQWHRRFRAKCTEEKTPGKLYYCGLVRRSRHLGHEAEV